MPWWAKRRNPNATRLTRLKLLCQRECAFGVSEHGPVEHDGQVSFEDPHGLSSGVAACLGVVEEDAGAWFVAELGHGYAVDRFDWKLEKLVYPSSRSRTFATRTSRSCSRPAYL